MLPPCSLKRVPHDAFIYSAIWRPTKQFIAIASYSPHCHDERLGSSFTSLRGLDYAVKMSNFHAAQDTLTPAWVKPWTALSSITESIHGSSQLHHHCIHIFHLRYTRTFSSSPCTPSSSASPSSPPRPPALPQLHPPIPLHLHHHL